MRKLKYMLVSMEVANMVIGDKVEDYENNKEVVPPVLYTVSNCLSVTRLVILSGMLVYYLLRRRFEKNEEG